MILVIDGKPVCRHYSLSAMPNGRSYRLSIKREPEGRGSRHFHDMLGVGGILARLLPADNRCHFEHFGRSLDAA